MSNSSNSLENKDNSLENSETMKNKKIDNDEVKVENKEDNTKKTSLSEDKNVCIDTSNELKKLRTKIFLNSIFNVFLIFICFGSFAYYLFLNHHEPVVPKDYSLEIAELHNSINSVKTLDKVFTETTSKLNNVANSQSKLFKQFESLEYAKNEILLKIGDKASIEKWKLHEIKYLLNLAQRKVAIDKDVKTAIALLQEADRIVISLDEPRAITLRENIIKDISTLGNYPEIHYEKVLLTLNELSKDISKIQPKNLFKVEKTDSDVSDNVKDWKANLKFSLNKFLTNFIQVREVKEQNIEILSLDKDAYIKENINLKINLAQKAYYNGDLKLYKELLLSAKDIVNTYYSSESQLLVKVNKVFDDLIRNCEEEMVLPEYLSSSIAIRDLIKLLEE